MNLDNLIDNAIPKDASYTERLIARDISKSVISSVIREIAKTVPMFPDYTSIKGKSIRIEDFVEAIRKYVQ